MGQGVLDTNNSFSAVAQGSTATLELERVNRLHQIDLYYDRAGTPADQATIESDIEWIEVRIGSGVQLKIYPVEHFKLMAERNRSFKSGRIPIFFSDPSRETMVGQDATSWNLEIFSRVTIRVKLASDVTNTNPGLKPKLLKTALERADNGVQVEAQGMIVTDRRIDVEVTDTTKTLVVQPESGRQIMSMHCFTNSINSLEVELPGQEKQEFTVAELQNIQSDRYMTPQSDVVSILGEAMTNRWSDAERLGNFPMRIKFHLANTNDFPILVKELGDRIR